MLCGPPLKSMVLISFSVEGSVRNGTLFEESEPGLEIPSYESSYLIFHCFLAGLWFRAMVPNVLPFEVHCTVFWGGRE